MSPKPKIEFYKLSLREKDNNQRSSFRNLFREKFNLHEMRLNLNGFFNHYSQNLVKEFDTEGYYLNNKKKKGYTLLTEEVEGEKRSKIKLYKDNWVITGVLDGGKHGNKRTLGVINNKQDKTPIEEDNIVCDKFYFLLSTPIDNSEGILMVQGYTDRKISDVFREHMRDFFSLSRKIQCSIEMYVPETLAKKHLENATFKSATFSTGWVVTPDFEHPQSKRYDLEVKVQIVDKSDDKMGFNLTESIVDLFGLSKLVMGKSKSKEKELKSFNSKTARIKNDNGKELPIKFDKDNSIKPVIYLEDEGIFMDTETGELNYDELDEYCLELLNRIEKEYLPENAIKDI
jgi:hypothetical protein